MYHVIVPIEIEQNYDMVPPRTGHKTPAAVFVMIAVVVILVMAVIVVIIRKKSGQTLNKDL